MSRKVLLVSLYHPELVPGGAQQACYELFSALQRSDWEPLLLGSIEHHLAPALFKSGAVITGFDGRPNEFLFLSQGYDHTWHRSSQTHCLEKFELFLRSVKPEVIHFHHYMTYGLEYLTAARRYLDTVGGRLILTLHEYIAICMAQGQMIRTFDQSLCDRASSVRCHQCFPQHSPEFFTMRRMWIKHHLGLVDQFVSPSEFLRQRYIEWGIPSEKIVRIANGHRVPEGLAPQSAADTAERPRNRFSFFGQLVDNKGLLLLFDAIKLIRGRGIQDFTVDVYGSNVRFASDAFRSAFDAFWTEEKAASKSREPSVRFNGSYEQRDLPRLMAGIDWVVFPSTWWENYPMVLSEAFLHGRPIICSDIGGMKERVRDGVDGLHFLVRNSESLASTMTRAMTEHGLWERLRANVEPPPTADQMAQQHIALCYGPARARVAATDKARAASLAPAAK